MTDRERRDDGTESQRESAPTTTPATGTGVSAEPLPTPKPSQAEGDRETIEEDLRDKGQE